MIIGITGLRGHGKTTAANVLKDDYEFVEYSFAKPLKEVCKLLFDLTDDQVYGDYFIKEAVDERLGVTPRKILQKFGSDFGRKYLHKMLPNLKIPTGKLWVEKFRWWYDNNKNDIKNVVIPDVRFLNEAKIIKELGGIIIRVHRPELDIGKDAHISETELLKIKEDYLITGEKDIETFREKIRKFYLQHNDNVKKYDLLKDG